MGAEFIVTASNVQIDDLVADLRSLSMLASDLHVKVTETHIEKRRCATLWGRLLSEADLEDWSEAREEADAGYASIETLSLPSGLHVDALVYDNPYREKALTGIVAYADPRFIYTGDFVTITCTWNDNDAPPLVLGFDRATAATGRIESPLDLPLVRIATTDGYAIMDDRPGTVDDYARAIEIIAILFQHASVDLDDPTGYFVSRSRSDIVNAMEDDRIVRTQIRKAWHEIVAAETTDRWITDAFAAVDADGTDEDSSERAGPT